MEDVQVAIHGRYTSLLIHDHIHVSAVGHMHCIGILYGKNNCFTGIHLYFMRMSYYFSAHLVIIVETILDRMESNSVSHRYSGLFLFNKI